MNEAKLKETIVHILEQQSTVLDAVLSEQVKLRQAVTTKNWECLQTSIAKIQKFSASFVRLDKMRETLSMTGKFTSDKDVQPVLQEVRGKLIKSKIENRALHDYTRIVQGFIQGILDKVIPQRRNVLYSKRGKIVKPQPESVVINKLF